MLSTALNWIALLGWCAVAVGTALEWSGPEKPSQQLLLLTLACECISATEVVRIALGMVCLHAWHSCLGPAPTRTDLPCGSCAAISRSASRCTTRAS